MVRLLPLLFVLSPLAALAENDLGAQLPDSAHKVAEHRYKSGNDLEGTMKFYKNIYPSSAYPRKELNVPGVHYVHIPNTSGKGAWEGLNIYEANDEVRIYVVPADGSGKKKKTSK